LTIKNFKGIKELSLDIENISIIIGPNNCSKSTLLEALCKFGSSDLTVKKNFTLFANIPFTLLLKTNVAYFSQPLKPSTFTNLGNKRRASYFESG